MHSSKGLEFHTVAVTGVGFLPTEHQDTEQAATILYVALTRATDNLLITSHKQTQFTAEIESDVKDRSELNAAQLITTSTSEGLRELVFPEGSVALDEPIFQWPHSPEKYPESVGSESRFLTVPGHQPTIQNIQKVVSEYYKMRVSDLHSRQRTRRVVRPRQIAMALAKELTTMSLPEIGDAFGGRDHTNVIHAQRNVEELIQHDSKIKEDYLILKKCFVKSVSTSSNQISTSEDAVRALVALGYSNTDAARAVRRTVGELKSPDVSIEALIRAAIKVLLS